MKYIIFLFLLFNTTFLFAQDNLVIKVTCVKEKTKKLIISIDSNKLYLTVDAVQDNLGGYIDIPENWYYLKTEQNIYLIGGEVNNENKYGINRFLTHLSAKNINVLQEKDLQFIQKINLETKKGSKLIRNIFSISFDNNFENEYKKCTN
jgi:hypothetical protein